MGTRTAARGRTGSLWSASLRRLAQRRSVILGYHGVAVAPAREDLFRLLVHPEEFTRQLELLLDAGFQFLTVAELAERLDGERPPAGLAAVSFDDGMRDNYTTALPILRPLGIRATVYVVSDLIGGQSQWITGRRAGELMNEDEIRALVAEGWEIGSHTVTHADLTQLDYAGCRREIEVSRDALERITGQPIRTLAYPFGRYGPDAIAAARDAGLSAALTTGSGSWAPLELTRAMISAHDPMPVVMLKLADRYEPLVRSPVARAIRRTSKEVRYAMSRRARGDDASPSRSPAG